MHRQEQAALSDLRPANQLIPSSKRQQHRSAPKGPVGDRAADAEKCGRHGEDEAEDHLGETERQSP